MSQPIPAGTIFTLDATISTTFTQNSDPIASEIQNQLESDGLFSVETYQINQGALSGAGLLPGPFQYIAQMIALTDSDTDSAIAEFNRAAAAAGTSASSVSIPAIGAVATGQPSLTAASPGGTNSLLSGVTGFLSGIQSTTTTVLIAIAAIVVLVLVLVAYSPNTRHIAAALA